MSSIIFKTIKTDKTHVYNPYMPDFWIENALQFAQRYTILLSQKDHTPAMQRLFDFDQILNR